MPPSQREGLHVFQMRPEVGIPGDQGLRIHGREVQVMEAPQHYWGWVAEGRYDHEWVVYDNWLKPEHAFIDLGAWVGAHSLYAMAVAKAIVAVEPDPVAMAILIENLLVENLLGKASIMQSAVSDEAGEITLGSGCLGASTTRKHLAAGGGIGGATETFISKKIALRKLAEEWPDPLFIKMDIEGMEEEVLRDVEFFLER